MKGRKIITILIIINLILVGTIYNLINKANLDNQKQIIKEMTETEYEDYITELNKSHEDYSNYIEESKKKIANAITEMGVETSNEATLETMADNIRNISTMNNYYEHVACFGKQAVVSSNVCTMTPYSIDGNLSSVNSNVLTLKKNGIYKIICTVVGYNVGPRIRYRINNGSWIECSSTSLDCKETEINISEGDTIDFSLYSGSTNGPMGAMVELVRYV